LAEIKVLSQELAEKIAAGEVAESPAAVIKELVENSLDAGATSVEVKVKGAGFKEISVYDNGHGLEAQEVPLAFLRHATSKLSSLKELYSSLNSLGFRGEALPSIAAVSKVSFTTKKKDQLSGFTHYLEGGKEVFSEEKGCPVGTEVVVRDLFFNTPARKEFRKTNSREVNRISQLITALAFSHPEVAFSLWNEGRPMFKTAGDGNIKNIITEAYGGKVSQAMLPLEGTIELEETNIKVSGFVSAPYLSRSSRRYQTLMVNRRLVRSSMITQSLERSYRGLLNSGRFPVAVLYLQVPASFLDVNIHPSKSEVRFHKSREIGDLVMSATKKALRRSSSSYILDEEYKVHNFKQNIKGAGKYFPSTAVQENGENLQESKDIDLIKKGSEFLKEDTFTFTQSANKNITLFGKGSFKVIGQYLSSYIVTEKEHNLVLIDQHAAHERVLYEQIKENHQSSNGYRIVLVAPLTLEIPSSWKDEFPSMVPMLEEAGFKVEPFGYNTFIIREIPSILKNYFNDQMFRDMVEEMIFSERYHNDALEDMFKLFSCKTAVKANQWLSYPEMEELISNWERTYNSGYCPHGRPTVLTLEIEQLQRGFMRKRGEP